MKKIIYTLFCSVGTLCAFAQIPNSGFENWNSINLNLPDGWRTFGQVSQATPATGTHSIRLERNPSNSNGPGAVIYGDPGNGNMFTGGIPFAARPDSLVANFKYSIPVGDSAWVLFMFKKAGSFISQDQYYVYGNNTSTFLRKAFAVHYTSGPTTPDSLIIGFTSTNPDSNFVGGYVILDDVHFVGTSTAVVPNGDFETWSVLHYEEPVSWFTPNQSLLQNPALPVTKTTDRHSGAFAARIENVNSTMGFQHGYMLAGPQGNTGMLPGFPVSQRDTVFSGFYKFTPVSNDTLMIGVTMFSGGVQVGWGYYQNDTATVVYKPFAVHINYDFLFTGVPDSATIIAAAFVGGGSPHGNSVLLVDDLSLSSTSASVGTITKNSPNVFVYPNPAHEYTTIGYVLEKPSSVLIDIYDVSGKWIETINNTEESSGAHLLKYNLTHLSNGFYSITVIINGMRQTRNITIHK